MAYNFYMATVQPYIPSALITEEDLKVLGLFFSSHERTEDDGSKTIYFFSKNFPWAAFDHEEEKYYWYTKMVRVFQDIIKRSNGALKYIYLHGAGYCDKMRPDEFNGWILFIEKDSDLYLTTWAIVEELRNGSESSSNKRFKDCPCFSWKPINVPPASDFHIT